MLICVLEDTVTEMGIILSMKLLCNTTEKNVVGNKKTIKQTNKKTGKYYKSSCALVITLRNKHSLYSKC